MGRWNTASAFLIWCRATEFTTIVYTVPQLCGVVCVPVGAPTVCTVSNKTASRSYNAPAIHDCGQLKTSSRTPPSYLALVPSPFLKNQIVDPLKSVG